MRSSIPKVMGILMIIFASLGLLFGLIGLGGPSGDEVLKSLPEWKTFKTVTMVFTIVGLAQSALHLVAGINAVKYKAGAPKLAMMYSLLAFLVVIANAVATFAWLKPMLVKALENAGGGGMSASAVGALVGAMVIVGTVLGLIWPTLVLILMSRPGAKAACTN